MLPCFAAAKEEFEAELATDSMDTNILDYCSLDPQVIACGLCRNETMCSRFQRSVELSILDNATACMCRGSGRRRRSHWARRSRSTLMPSG